MVNQTKVLVSYTQATLMRPDSSGKYRVVALSNISEVDRTAPFVTWIERLIHQSSPPLTSPTSELLTLALSADGVSEILADEWVQLSPPHLLLIKLSAGWRNQQGLLVLARQAPFSEQERNNLVHLAKAYGFALAADSSYQAWQRVRRAFKGKVRLVLLALVLASLFPVRLSVLSPAEITPISPHVVSAPFDGVVSVIDVQANQQVAAGDLLVELESSDYQAAEEVRRRAVNVAEANLRRAIQAGFLDADSRSQVASLEAELDLKKMELAQASLKKQNTKIKSERSGVVIVDNPTAWQGRPVQVGERILQIADPSQVEVTTFVSVNDAIALEAGRTVRVFLDTAPLSPLNAVLDHAAYKPVMTEDNIPSYRVTAKLSEGQVLPRIGLRGTAKIEGDHVVLFYYLFRRPVTALRQLIGW